MKKTIHIGMIGFGAVGFVIKQGFQLLEKDYEVTFSLFVRDIDKIKHIYNDVLEDVTLHALDQGLDTYTPEQIKVLFAGVDILINAATPQQNLEVMHIATIIGSHYVDMASTIGAMSLTPPAFPQEVYDKDFVQQGKIALINTGISPGITECLIAGLNEKHGAPQGIDILLQEHLYSDISLPSRSPRVALEELMTPPLEYNDKQLKTHTPFDSSVKKVITYEDGHGIHNSYIAHYPILQEELISIKKTFPNINDIHLRTGGGEVQQIKTLRDFGMLQDPGSLQSITKKLPNTATRDQIMRALSHDDIQTAYFGAIISYQTATENYQAKIKFDFDHRKKISTGPCAGATYISYPTGMGVVSMIDALITDQTPTPGVHNVLDYALHHPDRTKKVLETINSVGVQAA